jgi:hypothetical protein
MIGMKNKNGWLICINCVIVYTFRCTKTSSRIIQPVKAHFEQVHQASGFGGLNFVKTPNFMHYN